MQANQSNVIITVVLATLILLIGGYAGVNSVNNNGLTADEVASAVVIPTVNVPTAEEIAAEIKVPTLRNDNFDDLLEGIYPDEVEEIEDQCQDDLWDEFGDDVEDDVKDVIEADIGEDIEDVSIVNFNYDNDYDLTILNLGLDDDEDRAAEIFSVLKVRYHESFGDNDWHFAKVESTSTCNDYDENDNEFDNLKVEYIVA
tara:strand:+ start:209 stop:808 length:600 start_codon:yes stop_codon:yes gene_type:complete